MLSNINTASALKLLLEQTLVENARLLDRLDNLEERLALADELVDHILTSESMNPELELAEAYRAAGRGGEGMTVVYCYSYCKHLEKYMYDARFFKSGTEYVVSTDTLEELKARFPEDTEFVCYGREGE